jgi:predicted N-acyltransferase
MDLELRIHRSMRDLDERAFCALLRPDDPPFLRHEWLSALEQAGTVEGRFGWQPAHLTFWQGAELVAFAPAYLKGNSEGEFVFDHSWARFCQQELGVPYYPKLLLAVPFTPATGRRLLVRPGQDEAEMLVAFAKALPEVVATLGCSGAHMLFAEPAQASVLRSAGLLHRRGLQFHWHNQGYGTFDDFLARQSAKRRHQIRRERRELEKQGVELLVHTGSDITEEVMDAMFEFYSTTVGKFGWNRRYLNRAFFKEITASMAEALHLVVAWERGKPIAGAFNVKSPVALYGRYWGAREERPFLHFNVCYYAGIEECIRRGLQLFEPGAGGEHKLVRGFMPTATHSLHYLSHPVLREAVAEFLVREGAAIDEHLAPAGR